MTTNNVDPFDDFRALFAQFPAPDAGIIIKAQERQKQLTKPQGSLGRLEDIALWLAGWRAQEKPLISKPLVAIFAGNHGVTRQKITPFEPAATQQMVDNFTHGGAAINQICAAHNLGLKVYDLALDYPTNDITQMPAMDVRGCAATIAFGMEAIAGGTDLLILGEMGIGNTTIASALCHGLYGGKAEDWTGPGTGSTGEFFARKLAAVRDSVALHAAHLGDPFELLRRLGGREFAAMAGAILAARMQRIPVLLDGFVVCAAAAVLHAVQADALDHCLVGHVSQEPAHRRLLEILGKKPLLDLGMRLGEGSGAALAAGIIKAAALCHTQMATFAEAGITAP